MPDEQLGFQARSCAPAAVAALFERIQACSRKSARRARTSVFASAACGPEEGWCRQRVTALLEADSDARLVGRSHGRNYLVLAAVGVKNTGRCSLATSLAFMRCSNCKKTSQDGQSSQKRRRSRSSHAAASRRQGAAASSDFTRLAMRAIAWLCWPLWLHCLEVPTIFNGALTKQESA